MKAKMTKYTTRCPLNPADGVSNAALVGEPGAVELAVEPAEEAANSPLALMLQRVVRAAGSSRASAGVRISATITDSAIAETMVSENWR